MKAIAKPLVLLVTNVPVPYRYRLYRALSENETFEGWTVFESLSHGEVWASGIEDGVNYDVLGGRSVKTETGRMPVHFRLLRYLLRKSPDGVILSDFSPLTALQTFAYMALARKRVKLVSMTDENGDFFGKLSVRWARLWIRKAVLRRSSACICCSESSSRHIEAISKAIRGKTYISYLTPEADYYAPSAIRSPFGGAIELLTACRLVELKRVDRIIRAAAHLKARRADLDWKLTIVGDGPERGRLERLTAELGLERHVAFTGRLLGDALRRAYGRSNVFMLTSSKEPWGVVVHEAMLQGAVPIVTRSVGASELAARAGGVVVDDRVDEQTLIDDLADAMETLIENRDELAASQRRCREFAGSIAIDREVNAYLKAVQ
ncbi:glycosyltransferase family 4 protein [Cohnella hongkongensis]|uniref:Glycosyltransferase family 4 protein n=1 Tax=Cohnella hongkongensis TaxID=178337 RepID=A0ABV9F8T2_9BACL